MNLFIVGKQIRKKLCICIRSIKSESAFPVVPRLCPKEISETYICCQGRWRICSMLVSGTVVSPVPEGHWCCNRQYFIRWDDLRCLWMKFFLFVYRAGNSLRCKGNRRFSRAGDSCMMSTGLVFGGWSGFVRVGMDGHTMRFHHLVVCIGTELSFKEISSWTVTELSIIYSIYFTLRYCLTLEEILHALHPTEKNKWLTWLIAQQNIPK